MPEPGGIFKNNDRASDLCPNCGHRTALNRREYRVLWPTNDPISVRQSPHLVEIVWMCSYCNHTSIVWNHQDSEGKQHSRLVWPERKPRELPSEAPEALASLYREASVAEFAGALRGAATLYRAAAEELVNDQGITDGDLYTRINKLGDKGTPDDIVQDLHEARLLGNWSIHSGVTFAPDEIEDVALLIADAVEDLYVQPARREAMREARAARREAAKEGAAPDA